MEPDARELEAVFEACFYTEYRTRLVGGGDEPLYLPSEDPEQAPHRIVYREDYFSSALHEVAHWCLAGAHRRLLEDYGYWYAPDGRDAQQQADFERVEARPQALEWVLTDVCGLPFNLSADNLGAELGPSSVFAESVAREKARFLADGLPSRAERFRRALENRFSRGSAGSGKSSP